MFHEKNANNTCNVLTRDTARLTRLSCIRRYATHFCKVSLGDWIPFDKNLIELIRASAALVHVEKSFIPRNRKINGASKPPGSFMTILAKQIIKVLSALTYFGFPPLLILLSSLNQRPFSFPCRFI